jgi:hypothetical protein
MDLKQHFVQMPFPLSKLTQIVGSLSSNFSGEQRSKAINPEPDTFMANIDTTLMK